MNQRVQQAWVAFESRVLTPNIGAVQRREMRRAFYAGAFTILDTIAGAMSPGDGMTEDDERVMLDLAAEREAYVADLTAGRA